MTNEETIEALKSIGVDEVLEDGRALLMVNNVDEVADAIRLAIAALERDRWISVEERLPEKYGEYMILWKPKSYRTKKLFYEITEYEDGEWIGKIQQSIPYGGYEVFYWCELPAEPPKEET